MSHDQTPCYLRFRGRVSGPFPFSRVMEMAGNGLVSPIHEISTDRQAWNTAGDIPDLFPPPTAAVLVAAPAEAAPAPVAAAARAEKWYYGAAGGEQTGPVSREQLLSLFESGVIGGETKVWRSGMGAWVALADTDLLVVQPRPRDDDWGAADRRRAALRPGQGKAIAAMALGIVSVLCTLAAFLPVLLIPFGAVQLAAGVVAIILGAAGLKTRGRPFAVTGLVCGLVGVGLLVVIVVLILSLLGVAAVGLR